jgi:hypothetical protein
MARPPLEVVPFTLSLDSGFDTPIPTFCAVALDIKSNAAEPKAANSGQFLKFSVFILGLLRTHIWSRTSTFGLCSRVPVLSAAGGPWAKSAKQGDADK